MRVASGQRLARGGEDNETQVYRRVFICGSLVQVIALKARTMSKAKVMERELTTKFMKRMPQQLCCEEHFTFGSDIRVSSTGQNTGK